MEILGYFASILIGIILGLLGGGGSILTIPILVYLFQLDPVIAAAYSLFIVGVTSLIGVIPKQRKGYVNYKAAITFGLPSLLSVFVTRKWIVPAIPDIIFSFQSIILSRRLFLLGLFALLMIAASFSMIRKQKISAANSKGSNTYFIFGLALLVGLLTGLIGAGGGFLIIPALVLLAGLPMKVATGTSLLIMSINSLIGFTGDATNFYVDWNLLFLITALAVGGIFIGSWLSTKIESHQLRKGFGWFILTMGTWILIKEIINF